MKRRSFLGLLSLFPFVSSKAKKVLDKTIWEVPPPVFMDYEHPKPMGIFMTNDDLDDPDLKRAIDHQFYLEAISNMQHPECIRIHHEFMYHGIKHSPDFYAHCNTTTASPEYITDRSNWSKHNGKWILT